PPLNGLEGSTASTPTRCPRARSARTSSLVVVDLPTPGEPVRPMMRALPVYGASSAAIAGTVSSPDSTNVISRATARGSPSRARLTSMGTSRLRRTDPLIPSSPFAAHRRRSLPPPSRSWHPTSCLRHSNDQSVALAAAAAERRDPGAAAPAPQLQGEGEDEPGAGHPDRVTQRDRPAVDVDDVLAHPQVAHRPDGDRGEGLVDLNQVQVGEGHAGLVQRMPD